MDSIISHSPDETAALGARIATRLRPGDVLGIQGDLGAGKTHLIQGLAHGLGHMSPVTSPTFTLVHEYREGRVPLFHFDLYRLETEFDLQRIGFDDYLDAGGVLALEWADKFRFLLPRRTLWIEIAHGPENQRQVKLPASLL
jgi:tRNA threonylcarbamoyladenosine biosynthesis protein TsaE